MILMKVIGFIAAGYVLMVLTWVLYLALMNIARVKDNLHPVAKAHAYALLAVGAVFDVTFNVVFGSVMFLEIPDKNRWLFTSRLKKHIQGSGWRQRIAAWICHHLLDQFDKDGSHCS